MNPESIIQIIQLSRCNPTLRNIMQATRIVSFPEEVKGGPISSGGMVAVNDVIMRSFVSNYCESGC